MEIIKPGRQFDFMSKRWLFLGISVTLLVLSAISFIYPGPRLGTDFRGGTEVELAFTSPTTGTDLRAAIEKIGFSSPDVVSVADPANPYRFMIRVQEVSALSDEQKQLVHTHFCFSEQAGSAAACAENMRANEVKFSPGGDKISVRFDVNPDIAAIRKALSGISGMELRAGNNNPVLVSERDHKVEIMLKSKGDQLLDGLRAQLQGVPDSPLRVEWIGPKAGAQLRDAAIKSVGIAIFFIMAYLAFRFDLRFAPGAVVALIHDVGIALGAMVLAHKEITISTVAALLTIVGYSITDTVIVYDRIRENMAKHRDMSFSDLINLSISEMLGRTIITSFLTMVSLLAFLFFGTGVIKDFAFTMIVGLVVGVYSSIYIAAPLTEWIDRRFFASKTTQPKAPTRTRGVKRADAVV